MIESLATCVSGLEPAGNLRRVELADSDQPLPQQPSLQRKQPAASRAPVIITTFTIP